MSKSEPASRSDVRSFVQFIFTMLYVMIIGLLLAVIWLDPIKKSVLQIEQKVNQPCNTRTEQP